MSILAFSLSLAQPSADFLCAEVALRTDSACRVNSLGWSGVALARTARPCGVWGVLSGTGALHMLSMSYELSGNKGIPSVELRVMLQKYEDGF